MSFNRDVGVRSPHPPQKINLKKKFRINDHLDFIPYICNRMKVMITGGMGYIGTNLAMDLVLKGEDVVVVDDLSNSNPYNAIQGVEYKILHTKDLVESDLDGIKKVFHLGEFSRIVPSFEEVDKVFDSNILGTFNVIELCRKKEVPIIYGASSTRLCEEGDSHSPYAFFKSTIVNLIKNYGKWYGLQFSICYFYNVYGNEFTLKRSQYDSVVSIFNRQMNNGEPLTITGDGSQERDFTFAGDITDGLLLASENIKNEEYELGSGEKFTIRELAEMFEGEIKYIPGRPGDRKTSLADVETTKQKLGWVPRMKLRDWVKTQVAYYTVYKQSLEKIKL